MLDRLSTEERIVGGAAILAIASAYLTWFSYTAGNVQVGLNGFRASILGDVFVIAAFLTLVLLASHLRLVKLPAAIDYRRDIRIASFTCLGAMVLQILFSFDQGHHIHLAAGIALIAAAAMVLGSRRRAHRSDVTF